MSGSQSGQFDLPSSSTQPDALAQKKKKVVFREGILEQYGSAVFSEIDSNDPVAYADSKRQKAILEAKGLRELDIALGLIPKADWDTSTLSLKERRQHSNRLSYYRSVIGEKAVQGCLRDLFIGYEIRAASQKMKKLQLQHESMLLEKKLSMLKLRSIMAIRRSHQARLSGGPRDHTLEEKGYESNQQVFSHPPLQDNQSYNEGAVRNVSEGKRVAAPDNWRQSPYQPYQRLFGPTQVVRNHILYRENGNESSAPMPGSWVGKSREKQSAYPVQLQSLNGLESSGNFHHPSFGNLVSTSPDEPPYTHLEEILPLFGERNSQLSERRGDVSGGEHRRPHSQYSGLPGQLRDQNCGFKRNAEDLYETIHERRDVDHLSNALHGYQGHFASRFHGHQFQDPGHG